MKLSDYLDQYLEMLKALTARNGQPLGAEPAPAKVITANFVAAQITAVYPGPLQEFLGPSESRIGLIFFPSDNNSVFYSTQGLVSDTVAAPIQGFWMPLNTAAIYLLESHVGVIIKKAWFTMASAQPQAARVLDIQAN